MIRKNLQKIFKKISYGIYLKIYGSIEDTTESANDSRIEVKTLKKENIKFTGNSCGPASVEFFYGENRFLNISVHNFFPQVGNFVMFPANLCHWVYPFKSKGERISISDYGSTNYRNPQSAQCEENCHTMPPLFQYHA